MTETASVPTSLIGHLRGLASTFKMTAMIARMGQHPGDIYYELLESIQKPKIGDLVAEISSTGLGNDDNPNSVGYLLEMSGDRPVGKVKIRTLDGREVTWTNCRFIGLPRDFTWPEKAS
jgi:hypothetical protein